MPPHPLDTATAGSRHVPPDWMPASQVRSLIFEDPAILWLEYHGAAYDFQPDESPYSFQDFIAHKSHQFEKKWLEELAPGAITVCQEPSEVRQAEKVRQTLELMGQGFPVIAQPALWWAPERIYGAPDLIALASWLGEKFPGCFEEISTGQPGHYVVIDLKFTTKLEESQKAKDLANYTAQVRLYSFMLGNLQGVMPKHAYLFTRDRVADPLPVGIQSNLGEPLDADLAGLRDRFGEIKVNGSRYTPWQDASVAANLGHADERWCSAKEIIAREKVPGKDPALLYQVGPKAKGELAGWGYAGLDQLLQRDPGNLPLEDLKGFGPKKAGQVRAILQANRTKTAVLPPRALIPGRLPFEFYVDYEYFTNVDVDFERQWPTLEGCEMVFMIGIGWEQAGAWRWEALCAAAEDHAQERLLFERFLDWLNRQTAGAFSDPAQAALYHWSGAEAWQTQRAADRFGLAEDHSLRGLPWRDLEKVFLEGPAALPGAFDYSLKSVAKALGKLDPARKPNWAEDCDAGLRAMVMGWQAYRASDPLESQEFKSLTGYLEADCQALWNILTWLRAQP